MIDIENGIFRVNQNLIFSPDFSFEDFKKTAYYEGQDAKKIIYLKEQPKIGDHKFLISFFFRHSRIYMVSLISCDKEFAESEEEKRKKIHDSILLENGIENGKQYKWGKIQSEYDARSNMSSINIFYFE